MKHRQSIALITGAGRGIGAATALALASRGAKIALLSRSRAELSAVRDQIIKQGTAPQDVLILPTDLSKPTSIHQAFAETLAQLGPVSILVNNAGTIVVKAFTELTAADWDSMMDVNLKAAFLCCQEAFIQMKDNGGGSIINVSSLGGIQNTEKFSGFSAYTASKSGLVGLTEALAVEGRPFGIRVNCIAPGAVDTQMLKQAAAALKIPLKTSTQPEDIARVVAHFCEPENRVTGSILPIHSNE